VAARLDVRGTVARLTTTAWARPTTEPHPRGPPRCLGATTGAVVLDPGDILAIHQLLSHYGHLLDAKAWERLEEVFVAEATLDYTGVHAPDVCDGLGDIRRYFGAANHPSAHHVVNIVVTEDAGTVRVKSKFFVPFTRPSHRPQGWYGGDYDDVVVRTPDGWRFAHRSCTERWRLAAGEGPFPEGRGTF
jgi:hypothetical protein